MSATPVKSGHNVVEPLSALVLTTAKSADDCMPELLTSLPEPLKRAVLMNLTPKELLNACLVSVPWKQTIYGDAVLRKVLQDEKDRHQRNKQRMQAGADMFARSTGIPPSNLRHFSGAELSLGMQLLDMKLARDAEEAAGGAGDD